MVSSLVGLIGSPLRSGYAASKHALHGFFDSLRAEVSAQGIDVTLFCPGYVRTDISVNALTGDGTAQGSRDSATEAGLSPKACARQLVAATVAFRTETYVGGFECLGVYLKRLSPTLFARLLPHVPVT